MSRRPKVLLVEEVEAASFRRARVLAEAGFAVTETHTLTRALASVDSSRFSLALLDVRLPDGTGYELCRSLRQKRPDMPIVLISAAYVDDNARTTATFAGAVDFIAEPVSGKDLVTTLQRHL